MKEKGKLPVSEIITLDISLEQMRVIADGITPPIETTGIIAIPTGGGG